MKHIVKATIIGWQEQTVLFHFYSLNGKKKVLCSRKRDVFLGTIDFVFQNPNLPSATLQLIVVFHKEGQASGKFWDNFAVNKSVICSDSPMMPQRSLVEYSFL